MTGWVDVAASDALDAEDVLGVTVGARDYALYRAPDGTVSASQGFCSHEAALLAEGFVVGTAIECPRHQGRFDIRTGAALNAPACVDLRMYPVKEADGRLWLKLEGGV
jgi:MocE subfamily Rieske [2Fe-2S] domain protein